MSKNAAEELGLLSTTNSRTETEGSSGSVSSTDSSGVTRTDYNAHTVTHDTNGSTSVTDINRTNWSDNKVVDMAQEQSETVTTDAKGHRVGHMSEKSTSIGRGDYGNGAESVTNIGSNTVSHTLAPGESFDEEKFKAALHGEKIPGYTVIQEHQTEVRGEKGIQALGEAINSKGVESQWSSQSQMSTSSTTRAHGHSHSGSSHDAIDINGKIVGRTYEDGVSSGISMTAGTVSHSNSSHAGGSSANRGDAAVSLAVSNHLQSQGMSFSSAHSAVSSMGEALSQSVSMQHSGGPQSAHSQSLNFHNEGAVAVSVGHSIPSSEGTSVSMATIKDIHRDGMPDKGITEIRNNTGSELAGKSDLQVVDKLGHDVVKAVGEQGFPTKDVTAIQAEKGSSKMEALQKLGMESRAEAKMEHDKGSEPSAKMEAKAAQAEMSH